MLATVFVFNRMVERDEVRVPNVINMPTDKAVVLLVKTGLKPHIEEIYDPNMPPGRIVSQQPLPGRGVKRDRTVELVQSSGNPEVVVPRIVGRTLREADVLLAEKGGGEVEVRAYNSDYPEGQIFAQRPGPVPPCSRTSRWTCWCRAVPCRFATACPTTRDGRRWRRGR
ncbi:PASTA domain-containing protein [bacterium]|nr:PASTA domain-containing protein [bacterium]